MSLVPSIWQWNLDIGQHEKSKLWVAEMNFLQQMARYTLNSHKINGILELKIGFLNKSCMHINTVCFNLPFKSNSCNTNQQEYGNVDTHLKYYWLILILK